MVTSWSVAGIADDSAVVTGWFCKVTPRSHWPANGTMHLHGAAEPDEVAQGRRHVEVEQRHALLHWAALLGELLDRVSASGSPE